jgi:ornithine carbamoyltransferase
MDVVIAAPDGFGPDAKILELARQDAQASGAVLSVVKDPEEAVQEQMSSILTYGQAWDRKKMPRKKNSNLEITKSTSSY